MDQDGTDETTPMMGATGGPADAELDGLDRLDVAELGASTGGVGESPFGNESADGDGVDAAVNDIGGLSPADEGEEEDEEDEEDDDEPSKEGDAISNLPKWILVLVCITLLVTFLNSLLIMAKTNPVLNTLKDRQGDQTAQLTNIRTDIGNLSTRTLGSYRMAVPYITPRTFQMDRGTCWDFATVNLLEWSYREHGIKNNWLKEDEYVKFNQQAYGISMMRECWKDIKMCQEIGDMVALNSTEGGEIGWLWYFPSMYRQLLPDSVCPYINNASRDWECPNFEDALKSNPVKFNIESMTTAYNVRDTKNLMLTTGRPMGWSSLVHTLDYHFPCSDDYWKTTDACSVENRVPCPTDRNYPDPYCAQVVIPCYNMDGEFYDHDDMVIEGGHGMNAVGFNDEYVTRAGAKGGFIIKNSWEDKLYAEPRGPRGSHSIKWWMQEISDWDERRLCPGALNPTQWMSCITMFTGPTSNSPLDALAGCLSPHFMHHMVDIARQPTEFRCLDSKFCNTSDRIQYFLKESHYNVQNDQLVVCMAEYNNATQYVSEKCTPPMVPDVIALIWTPVDWQLDLLKDDDDYCGFYFFPYDLVEKQMSMYGGFYATDFKITWDKQSYAAVGGGGDYFYVRNSTLPQKTLDFSGPYAWNDHRVPA